MTKRHCYVTDVGDAIEALADALDPERTKPFGGDILDLLEWAAKDVLAMRQQVAELTLSSETYFTERNSARDARRRASKERDQLRQQVTLLRERIKQQGESTNTCTFNILKEVCQDCACHRAKEQ